VSLFELTEKSVNVQEAISLSWQKQTGNYITVDLPDCHGQEDAWNYQILFW